MNSDDDREVLGRLVARLALASSPRMLLVMHGALRLLPLGDAEQLLGDDPRAWRRVVGVYDARARVEWLAEDIEAQRQ